jgi:hypothetical protein
MPTKVTRRQLAIGIASVRVLAAQAPAPSAPKTPEEELQAALEQTRQNAQALARVELPMTTEPAFTFKV